jgi:hypothetical protein
MEANYILRNCDTVIVMLQKIESFKNNWDIIGDYSYESDLPDIDILRLNEDSVKGFIAGHIRPDKYSQTKQFKALKWTSIYKFKSLWSDNSNCNDILNSLKSSQVETKFSFNNPITSSLKLKFNAKTKLEKTIEIFNLSGNKISSNLYNSYQVDFDFSSLPKGLYFVKIYTKEEEYLPIRIVKQ